MKDNRVMSSRILRSIATLFIASGLTLSPIALSPTSAACNPVTPKGQRVGSINVGPSRVPIIPFTYPAGGVMEPQKTTEALFMSLRHMPLSSSIGTTVLAWHVNFNECQSDLNTMIGDEKVGFRFKITDETGVTKTYRISEITVVKKGRYKKSWFSLVGPRQLALFTCTGAFRNGHYLDNKVFIAVPA